MLIAVELVSWWVVATAIWMASLSAYTWHDLVVAAGCGVPCALAAMGGRRAMRGSWRVPLASLRWLVVLPATMVADALRVFALPFSPASASKARFEPVDLKATGESPRAAGHRAVASLFLSVTPGSYVVSTDPDEGTALLHVVGPASALQREIAS